MPVLGIVENMALHTCSHCGHTEHIFGEAAARACPPEYSVPLLGSLPLDIHIREQADGGTPTVAADPGGCGRRAVSRDRAARPRRSCAVRARSMTQALQFSEDRRIRGKHNMIINP